jgi:hypothetical protein
MGDVEFLGMLVLALSTLAGLFFMLSKPLNNHTKAMTENTCAIKNLSEKFEGFEKHNKESHKRIWDRVEKHECDLTEHDRRILFLEQKEKEGE